MVLAATFAGLLLLPLLSLVSPPLRLAIVPPSALSASPLAAAPAAAAAAVGPAAASLLLANAVRPATVAPRVNLGWLLGLIWLGGALLAALPVEAGRRRVRALVSATGRWPAAEPVLAALANRLGLRRRVPVLISDRLAGPAMCGWRRPAILLPPAAREWAPEALECALAHEIEHVRRGDHASQLAARFVCALYWFHPLAWRALQRLELEAERACDDAALAIAPPVAYASHLVEVAQRMRNAHPLPLPGMARRSDLSARVRAVLDLHQCRRRAHAFWALLALAPVVAMVAAMAPLQATSAPRPQSAILRQSPVVNPQFDAATIKPARPDEGFTDPIIVPMRLSLHRWTLKDLLQRAYALKGYQVQGPALMAHDYFDLDAEVQQPANERQMDAMLKTFLIARFSLITHTSTRITDAYLLQVAASGSKLQGGAPDEDYIQLGFRGRYDATLKGTAPMGSFATFLSRMLGIPVIDASGLAGTYQFSLKFRPGPGNRVLRGLPILQPNEESTAGRSGTPAEALQSIFAALPEQLGLKLVAHKEPIKILVVDAARRVPLGN
ncbi:MAG: TIGR03435 family protein [Terriglobales bacterium]